MNEQDKLRMATKLIRNRRALEIDIWQTASIISCLFGGNKNEALDLITFTENLDKPI